MFKTLQALYPKDKDFPERTHRLQNLTRILRGKIYDCLETPFHQEKNGAGEYVPLRDRRPSARYGLCRIVVEDSVSMLFSEGHFPEVECEDEPTKEGLKTLAKELALNLVMIDAATRGSVGSVVIFLRVLRDRLFLQAQTTEYLTPEWEPEIPDQLKRLVEQYKVKGEDLQDAGYTIDKGDLQSDFWFRTEWDSNAETIMLPVKVDPATAPTWSPDPNKTIPHALGFVPAVWVKNLPGGDAYDGEPTFSDEVIDTSIEIDYLLSQNGRGLKYAADPTLLIKEPAFSAEGPVTKGAANALVVSGQFGDAKLLEINGTASAAVVEWVRFLRELALETAHGNRANADKLSAAQSGRAMELMNQALIWLADRLRITYGEGALLDLLRMIVRASNKRPLKLKDGTELGKLSAERPLTLRWPKWYQPTSQDSLDQSATLKAHREAGNLSQETAVKSLADDYDIEDVAAELAKIKGDDAERQKAELATIQATAKSKQPPAAA